MSRIIEILRLIKRILPLLALVVFSTADAIGQKNESVNDSMRISGLIHDFEEKQYEDSAAALQSISLAIEDAQALGELNLLLEALMSRGNFFMMNNALEKAESDMHKALLLTEELPESEMSSDLFNNLGILYYYQGDYRSAVEAHIEAARIAENQNYPRGSARSFNNIGNIYIKLREYQKAHENYLQAYKITAKNDMKGGQGHILGNLGITLMNLEKFDSAASVIRKSLSIHMNMNNQRQVNLNYSNLGRLFYRTGNYDSSNFYYKKYLQLSRQQGNLNNELSAAVNLMDLEMNFDNYDEAQKLLYRYDSSLQEIKSPELKSNYYRIKAALLERKGEFRQSLEAYKKYDSWKDSVEGNELKAKIEALNMEYGAEKTEKELIEKEALLDQRESENTLIIIISLFLIVLTVLIFLLIRQKRENRYQKDSIAAITKAQEKERRWVARDLHDSVGVMLANLKNRLSTYPGIEEEIEMIDTISREVRQISHNMLPGTLNKFGLEAAIRSELEITARSNGLKASFNQIGLNGHLNKDTQVHLFRIAQEAIHNIVKHSQAKNINLSIREDDSSFVMMIEDDGKGFDKLAKANGNGLTNMRTRAEIIRGRLSIDSHPNAGTSIIVELDINDQV